MPDIDLPTVIFALVALFVAFKLRSVLGTRNDGERPTGGLLAPLRRAPGPAGPPAAPPEPAAAAPAPAPPPAERWQGFAAPEAWGGLDAIAAADRSFAPPGVPVRRARRLRNGRPGVRRRRPADPAKPDGARRPSPTSTPPSRRAPPPARR